MWLYIPSQDMCHALFFSTSPSLFFSLPPPRPRPRPPPPPVTIDAAGAIYGPDVIEDENRKKAALESLQYPSSSPPDLMGGWRSQPLPSTPTSVLEGPEYTDGDNHDRYAAWAQVGWDMVRTAYPDYAAAVPTLTVEQVSTQVVAGTNARITFSVQTEVPGAPTRRFRTLVYEELPCYGGKLNPQITAPIAL